MSHPGVSTLDAIVQYVEALSGGLDVVADFDDHTLTVTTADAALSTDAKR